MDLRIRALVDDDVESLVEISLLAWAPVFASFERVLGVSVFSAIWPDWRAGQRAAVETVCREKDKTTVLVAEWCDTVAGFLAYELNAPDGVGEVQLLAVHPRYQNRGIGTELNLRALCEMRARGMRMAKVETGGDPSHAPARRSYEKAGYTALPLVRYFQTL